MSGAPSPTPAAQAVELSLAQDGNNATRKSYRRKYRKIMVTFEEKMRESNGLFKDEQRIFDISQRLAEQADQILELLLELNQLPQVPQRFRYNLTPVASTTDVAMSGGYQDEKEVHEKLRLARSLVQKGEISAYDHQQAHKDILELKNHAPTKSYTSLLRTTRIPSPVNDTLEVPTVGVLTARQEAQYLQSLDEFLDGKNTNPRAHAAKSLGSRTAERTADREREMQLKNPVSVYNWLRKHQPQVFLQDHETGEKSKSSGSRSSKRTAPGKDAKQDQDYYDEDGIALDQGGPSRGKRKRGDEDSAFRPKGGRSSHPSKRRKDDGSGKRSKRSSMDARSS